MDLPNQPTQLHSAARSLDLETAELLLKKGIDINFKDEKGLTPLHILVEERIKMFDSLHANECQCTPNTATVSSNDKPLDAVKDETLTMKLEKRVERKRKEFISNIKKKIEESEKFIHMLLKHKNSSYNYHKTSLLLNFYAACTLKDFSMVELFLGQVGDVNQPVPEDSPFYPGYTALHFAAHCCVNVATMLIEKGANLLIQDAKDEETPLDIICRKLHSIKEILSIMNSVSAWRNILFSDGKTKLMDYICSLRKTDAHKKILDQIDKNIPLLVLSRNSPLWPGHSILHVAVSLFQEDCRNDIILKDILLLNTNYVNIQNMKGSSPIHIAFQQNKLKIAELLLENHHHAMNLSNKDNLTHLHIAAAVNDKKFVEIISKNETNLNVAYKGRPLTTIKVSWTPLHTAAYTAHAVVAKMLHKKGANLLETDSQGLTAIHLLLGTNSRYKKVSEFLFASNQLKECTVESSGLTHLHVAVWKKEPEAIKRLLDLGSNIEATIGKLQDKDLKIFEGCRPIHIAMMGHNPHLFEILTQRGANILAKNSDGLSPLFELLTGKYRSDYLQAIIDLLWSSEKWQKKIEDEFGLTMLHVACYGVDIKKVKILLKKGMNVNMKARDDSSVWPGFTLLHILTLADLNKPCPQQSTEDSRAERSIIDNLFDLLHNEGSDVTLVNAQGDTPVHMAMKFHEGLKRANFLVQRQRAFNVNPTNKANMSHFHVTCLMNDVKTAEKFLRRSYETDVNQAVNSSENGRFAGCTPLHMAIKAQGYSHYKTESQIKIVDLLLERGADLHASDTREWTPLHQLVVYNPINQKLLDRFLVDKIDINKRTTDGKTPLEILLTDGRPVEVIKYFVARGAQINSHNPVSGIGYMASVHLSKKYKPMQGRIEIMRMMLKSPDITKLDTNERNAIHNAVASGQTRAGNRGYRNTLISFIEALIGKGCNIFKQDITGSTALHLAVKFQNSEAIEALLHSGADVNIVDVESKSPFSYAWEFFKSNRPSVRTNSNVSMCRIIAQRINELQYFGLQVSDQNAKLLSKVMNEIKDINTKYYMYSINEQLKYAEELKINKSKFALRDLLYPTKSIIVYNSLEESDRYWMKHHLGSNKFGSCYHLKPFLKLQYRSAVERSSLIEPAVNDLRKLLGFPLPDLCVDIILKYLTNSDMKSMTMALR